MLQWRPLPPLVAVNVRPYLGGTLRNDKKESWLAHPRRPWWAAFKSATQEAPSPAGVSIVSIEAPDVPSAIPGRSSGFPGGGG